MSDIQIYRSGVCYLRTCNRKGVHKENFDCLWDPEWCTLQSKVSFIASLQVDFLRDEVARSFPSWPITHPKTDFKKVSASLKKRSLHSNLHSLNLWKRKSILTTIYSLNLCLEWWFRLGLRTSEEKNFKENKVTAVKQQELKERKEEGDDKSEKK